MADIRKRLRQKLLEQDLTIADIARRHRLNYTRLLKVISGLRRPRRQEAEILGKFLDIDAEDLLRGTNHESLR